MSEYTEQLSRLLLNDPQRMHLMGLVTRMALSDCWIGAGFVRSLVWDYLHGRTVSPIDSDVDVVWFDPVRASAALDRDLETQLTLIDSSVEWSVTNQARMHARNGDAPYLSTEDAIRHWPDTAGAVGVRLVGSKVDIIAPYGISDLFSLTAKPTPAFEGAKLSIFLARLQEKRWRERWPLLVLP